MNKCALLLGLVAMQFTTPSNSANWSSCAYHLNQLSQTTQNAAYAANKVKSKANDLDNCKLTPESFDLMRDHCRSMDYDYRSAVNSLERILNEFDSSVQLVRSSCGSNSSLMGAESPTGSASPSRGEMMCDLYRGYRRSLPFETLIKSCATSMPEAECRKCLSQ